MVRCVPQQTESGAPAEQADVRRIDRRFVCKGLTPGPHRPPARSCASPPAAITLCCAWFCLSRTRKHTSPFQRRTYSVSNAGWRKRVLTPNILLGRRLAIQTGHPIAVCPRSKPRMPAFSSAATARSRGARPIARVARDYAAHSSRHSRRIRRIRHKKIVFPARQPVSAAQTRRPDRRKVSDEFTVPLCRGHRANSMVSRQIK